MRAPRPIAEPDETSLREAALSYLARYSATEAGLRRVLDRKVDRWARSLDGDRDAAAVAAAHEAVRAVVARLAAAGAVDNKTFAEARTRSLMRAGRSRRAVAAHLAAKGVDAATARAVLPSDEASELGAAIALTARRRIGAFRGAPADDSERRRELGMMARAGFPQAVAVRALGMDREAAEAILHRLRTG